MPCSYSVPGYIGWFVVGTPEARSGTSALWKLQIRRCPAADAAFAKPPRSPTLPDMDSTTRQPVHRENMDREHRTETFLHSSKPRCPANRQLPRRQLKPPPSEFQSSGAWPRDLYSGIEPLVGYMEDGDMQYIHVQSPSSLPDTSPPQPPGTPIQSEAILPDGFPFKLRSTKSCDNEVKKWWNQGPREPCPTIDSSAEYEWKRGLRRIRNKRNKPNANDAPLPFSYERENAAIPPSAAEPHPEPSSRCPPPPSPRSPHQS